MAPWTLQERMTLHVLFGHHKLNFYGRDWWALHHDITKTWRTERTCREDYKYSHGKERTKMEWECLLRQGGFKLTRVVPTRSLYCIIEAKPCATRQKVA